MTIAIMTPSNNQNKITITESFLRNTYIGKILYLQSFSSKKTLNDLKIIITSIEKHPYSENYFTFKGYELIKNKMDSNQISKEILIKINENGIWECEIPSLSGSTKIKYSIF